MNKYILVAASLLLLVSCKEKTTTQKQEVQSIDVSSPQVKNIVLKKEYPGTLTSNRTVELVARVDGTIIESNLVPGAFVREGDILFVIEPTTYENQLRQSEAQLETNKAQYAYAESNYERMKMASESGAVSEIQVLEAAATAKEQAAAIATAEAELNTARTNLGYCYVKAPCNGRVTNQQYDVGNYVAGAAQAVTLATLYKDDTMYAYFNIDEGTMMDMINVPEANKLPKDLNNKVTIRIGSNKGAEFEGVIDYMSPDVDVTTGTVNMRAVVKNPNGILKDGMYIMVELPYCIYKDAILVTDASLSSDQLGQFLYLVNDSNVVESRHVEVGQLVEDTLVHVMKGLTPNDIYVKSALLKVRNGMKIKPIKK